MSANDDTRVKREREEGEESKETLSDEKRARMKKMLTDLASNQPEFFSNVLSTSKQIDAVIDSIGDDGDMWHNDEPHPFDYVNEEKVRAIVTKKIIFDSNVDPIALQKTIETAINGFFGARLMEIFRSQELYDFIEQKVNEM